MGQTKKKITLTIAPTLKQHQTYQALDTHDEIFIGGGAGGGKSWIICESRLVNCIRYPGYKSFIGREELKRLMQSTFVTWQKVCKHHSIPKAHWKLNGQYNYIEFWNGSRIDLLDLKLLPSDPLYERFGSLEYSDGAIEEAGEVHFLAYDVLKSRIGRHMQDIVRSTFLISGNPKKNWTYKEFYKPHKEKRLDPGKIFIQSLYSDNPYTAEAYGKRLSAIKDKATKQRLMFGNWEYDDDPNTMIEYDNIIDLFTNTIDKNPELFITVDVARYGRDKTVISLWRGLDCIKIEEYEKQSITETAKKVSEWSNEYQVPFSHIVVDEDGVGGGVVDILNGVKGFTNNATPFINPMTGKPDNYQNLKTQCYYLLAECVNSHSMKISAELSETQKEAIIEELEQVKQVDADKDGKKKLISKEDVKELIGRSPDYSDNLMMRMYLELDKPMNVLEVARQHQMIQRNRGAKKSFR